MACAYLKQVILQRLCVGFGKIDIHIYKQVILQRLCLGFGRIEISLPTLINNARVLARYYMPISEINPEVKFQQVSGGSFCEWKGRFVFELTGYKYYYVLQNTIGVASACMV